MISKEKVLDYAELRFLKYRNEKPIRPAFRIMKNDNEPEVKLGKENDDVYEEFEGERHSAMG